MAVALPHLAGVEHAYVDAGGLRTHVALAGDPGAPPVVLLHGWPQHWWAWRGVIPPLARSYRVICPDLRGLGWTAAPPGGYAKEQLASDVLALLDALELPSVRFVGHDWGGWVGFLMALHAPERFARLMILNVAHPWPGRDLRRARHLWRFWYQAVLSAPGAHRLVAQGTLLRLMLTKDLRHPGAITDADRELYLAPQREPARARASSLYYRTLLLQEMAPLAAGRYRDQRLTVPTRVLFGVHDLAVHPDLIEGLEVHADDAHVELVADSGHFLPEERPELVAERALAFFD